MKNEEGEGEVPDAGGGRERAEHDHELGEPSATERRIEQLLRERARSLDAGVLAPERAERVRAELRAEAAREATQLAAARARRSRVLRAAAALAAAVIALVVLGPWRPWSGPPRAAHGELAVEIALLDPLGRPLRRATRSGPASEPFARPESALLEIEAAADGFVVTVPYDPLGARRLDHGAREPIGAGEIALVPLALADLPVRPAGESVAGVCIVSSHRPIGEDRIEAAFPPRIEPDPTGDPSAALARVAEEAARALGCTVEVRTLTLDVR